MNEVRAVAQDRDKVIIAEQAKAAALKAPAEEAEQPEIA